MKRKELTDKEFIKISWNELTYNSEDDYYGCTPEYNDDLLLENGIVSPRWILRASWDEIRNFKPPRYYKNKKNDLEIFKTLEINKSKENL